MRRTNNKNHRGGLAPEKYLTAEQLRSLRRYAIGQARRSKSRRARTDKLILDILALAGLRASELCDLRIRDLPHSHGKHKLMVRDGKGHVARAVDVSPALGGRIRRYVDEYRRFAAPMDFLFIACNGHPVAYHVVWRKVRRMGRAVGLDLHPHTLRHTAAVTMYEMEKDLRWVQDQLGHADPETTAIYARTSSESARRQARRMR